MNLNLKMVTEVTCSEKQRKRAGHLRGVFVGTNGTRLPARNVKRVSCVRVYVAVGC